MPDASWRFWLDCTNASIRAVLSDSSRHSFDSQRCNGPKFLRENNEDWLDAQANLSLRWAYVSEGTFSHFTADTLTANYECKEFQTCRSNEKVYLHMLRAIEVNINTFGWICWYRILTRMVYANSKGPDQAVHFAILTEVHNAEE